MVTATAREENGEFCVAVAPATGLLVYWPSWLKSLAVKLSGPSGRSGSYTGLIGFNPRWLKGPKRGWAPTQRTYVYAKSSSSSYTNTQVSLSFNVTSDRRTIASEKYTQYIDNCWIKSDKSHQDKKKPNNTINTVAFHNSAVLSSQ